MATILVISTEKRLWAEIGNTRKISQPGATGPEGQDSQKRSCEGATDLPLPGGGSGRSRPGLRFDHDGRCFDMGMTLRFQPLSCRPPLKETMDLGIVLALFPDGIFRSPECALSQGPSN